MFYMVSWFCAKIRIMKLSRFAGFAGSYFENKLVSQFHVGVKRWFYKETVNSIGLNLWISMNLWHLVVLQFYRHGRQDMGRSSGLFRKIFPWGWSSRFIWVPKWGYSAGWFISLEKSQSKNGWLLGLPLWLRKPPYNDDRKGSILYLDESLYIVAPAAFRRRTCVIIIRGIMMVLIINYNPWH